MHTRLRALAGAATFALAVLALGLTAMACGGGATASSATPGARPTGMPPGGQMGDPTAMLTKPLDKLVASGTITSAQERAVLTALKSTRGNGPAGGTPPSGGQTTPPSPAAGGQGAGPGAMFTTALDTLVEKGTITKAQETAIVKAITQGLQQMAPGGGGT